MKLIHSSLYIMPKYILHHTHPTETWKDMYTFNFHEHNTTHNTYRFALYSTLTSFTILKIEIKLVCLLAKNNMETLVRSMNTGFMTVGRGREYQETITTISLTTYTKTQRGMTQKHEARTKNYGAKLLCNPLHAVTPTCLWPSGMFWMQLPAGDSDDVRAAGRSRWLTQSRGRGGGVRQYTAPVCSPSPVYTPSAGHLRSCHHGHCLKHSLIGW